MPKLPQISGEKLVKIFIKEGWTLVSQKGSHIKLTKKREPIGKSTIIIPNHKVIKKGTLLRIIKDSGISTDKL
ncbi:MAG: hypothetical protein ACD_30C00077G0002 [uncultured bacterium]|uniref:YcfA family protein n=3 Tax=Candidatus Daviesiibacteriota TaxID=1752718 RepID=A0A0G0HYF0_9BACT|nr:MAG: hypothetical protein ACD_30C00077G0002 [uncultured bacterium]KKQ08886.1 MAG: hypothetical protein US19_C0018G0003 [Candidatus Daviesbacteria bacterium GW2011_GWB1_36_5]KKQ13876.1 MAG: hypothetical protein US28_C0043G0007 [Candidatus Daviesbacteria bacterium GW2011_GWA1_36_8]OGE34334.1 MAG: hypothetical protein A3E66_04930 [Candidatus Daviesbacteria bacterium RIFCSPHIGHO2_12_FULL_37_16]